MNTTLKILGYIPCEGCEGTGNVSVWVREDRSADVCCGECEGRGEVPAYYHDQLCDGSCDECRALDAADEAPSFAAAA